MERKAMLSYWLEGMHQLRDVVLAQLNDAELTFSPGGENAPFGQILKELSDLEHIYTQSLSSLVQDWTYKNEEVGLASNLAQLKATFGLLDQELKAAIDRLTPEDLQKNVDRGHDVLRTIDEHLSIYIQAQMIFLGKAVVYLRAMGKPLPESLRKYIG